MGEREREREKMVKEEGRDLLAAERRWRASRRKV